MHEYVDNILEKKIALVSLAIIMVLTGITFGIGFQGCRWGLDYRYI